MNSESALISAVCQNKDIAKVMADVDDSMFVSHKDVWIGLKSYYYKYQSVPDVSVLTDRFTLFTPEKITSPTAYYVDKLREDYLGQGLRDIILGASKSIKESAPQEVLIDIQNKISSLSKHAHVVRDVDVTDVDDAQDHYEALMARSNDMGGSPGIQSGFRSMDINYPTGFAPGHLAIMLGYSARGKAEDVNKIIPTPDGHRRFGDLLPGDKVWARDGKAQEVLAIHPQGVIDAYRISFSDGTNGVFSGDHLWSFYSGQRGQERDNLMTMTTLEIIERGLHHVGSGKQRGNWKVRLPLPEPVQYDNSEVPIDPYVLGYLLGDGSLGYESVYFTTADEYCAKEISSRVDGVKHYGGIRYGINKMIGYIKALGLNVRGDAKFIPHVYSHNSIDVRLDLLRGLLDSDGSVKSGERAYFHNCNERLVDDVAELVRSLGGVAQKHFKPRRDKTDEYALSIWLSVNPFILPRKADLYNPRSWFKAITKVEKVDSVEMMCITVESEDHLYLTENYTVTHNTWLAGYLAIKAWEKGFKPMIISMEMTPEAMRDRIYAMMGSGLFNMTDLQLGSIDIDDFRTWGNKTLTNKQNFVIVSNDGTGDVTPDTIQAKYDEHRPDMIVIDYLQLMGDGKGSRGETERVRNISRDLKGLAVRNGVPIIAISAVTMTDVTAVDSPPMLEQVSNSKAIQYDADLALAVHRYDDTNIVEIVSRKNRHGKDFAFYLEVDFAKGIIKESFDAQIPT